MTLEDKRSKKFVLLPFCVICQAFQAKGLVKHKWHGMIKPLVRALADLDVNVIQMPCPEGCYKGYESGLRRQPKGISEYDCKDFRQHCAKLAADLMCIIRGILANDYQIIAILGIERSPSCAVNYQYTNAGTIRRQGIFIENLMNMLKEESIKIPFVGIEKKIERSIAEIREICSSNAEK